jgi:hypothetical protein
MEEGIPTQLLQQRIRNEIIDYLQLAASAEAQRDYERRVPIAQVPAEMINMWEDSVHADRWDLYSPPVYSEEESEAMRGFHQVWLGVADEIAHPTPHTIEALIGTPVWNRLMAAPFDAVAVFDRRGRLSDVAEEKFPV